MKKRNFGIFALLTLIIVCFTLGFVSCSQGDDEGRINPRIMIETDETEFSVELYSEYTMPYAGVYYENLDRVDGKEVRMSVIAPSGGYLYEDILDYEIVTFVFAGKYQIVYKAEGCEDAVITIYSCKRLDRAEDFAVNGNTLTWSPVQGASGYTVTVNGKESVDVDTESFTSDIFSQTGFYVGVVAKGDNKKYLDSYLSSYENRIPLKEGELAAFNEPSYELDISQGMPNDINPEPSEIEWLTEEKCAGSTDGALKVRLKSGPYGWSMFRVDLEKTIDLENCEGLEVRFKLDTKDYMWNDENYPTSFILSAPDTNSNSAGDTMWLPSEYNDHWLIYKLGKDRLGNYDGKDFLHFNLYDMTRTSGSGYLYLDYIRLYGESVATPENLTVSDNKLTWSAVENAAEYMVALDMLASDGVSVISKMYYVNANEIALSDMGISDNAQYDVKVCAVSSDEAKGSSAWSEIYSTRTQKDGYVAEMDNALCVKDVSNVSVKQSGSITNFYHLQRIEYASIGDAEGGKALHVVFRHEWAANNYVFKLRLTEPLDFEREDTVGIAVRFKVDYTTATKTKGLRLQLAGPNDYAENYTGRACSQSITIGEWQELQLSINDLKEYYEDGATELYFSIMKDEAEGNTRLAIDIDNIRYYNSLATPANVRLDRANNALVWDEVEGANGYVVSVNGDEYAVETNRFDMSALTEDCVLKVRTECELDGYGSSQYSGGVSFHVLEGKQVAAFTNESYAYDVVVGNPNITNGGLSTSFRPSREPAFDATQGTGGSVAFNLYSGKGNGQLHTFTVLLYKGLDFTTEQAIAIRLAIPSISLQDNKAAYFSLLHATDKADGSYQFPKEASNTCMSFTPDGSTVKWMTLVLGAKDLAALGYQAGATSLTFGVWSQEKTNPGIMASVKVYLDDISYYSALATPENVRIEGKKLVWDAVAEATGYTVKVNGVETLVTTNEFDISQLTEDASLQVRTETDKEGYSSSLYSDKVYYYAPLENAIANFNSENYIQNVVAGHPDSAHSAITTSFYEAPKFDKNVGNGGAVFIRMKASGISNPPYTVNIFAVNLQEGLDLTKGDGISVTIAVTSISGNSGNAYLAIGNVGVPGNSYETACTDETKAVAIDESVNFVTIKFTMAELEALGYTNGRTTITFCLWQALPNNPSVGATSRVWLDDISYYKN